MREVVSIGINSPPTTPSSIGTNTPKGDAPVRRPYQI